MRRWQNLAPPNDPGSWYDVDGVWPTSTGSYEAVDFLTGTAVTATGSSLGAGTLYAYCAKTLSSRREYVITEKIWQYAAGALTERTGGVSIGAYPMMAQYGDVTICVMGTAAPTVSSTGGNFAALAGAPQGEIVVVQSNAVVIFNTNTSADGWHASDVGDYTNWSTGESASGRIIQTPGPIRAAVPFGNDILVFKDDAIYRMRYVGGLVKWTVELAWKGVGVGVAPVDDILGKYACCAGNSGVLFAAYYEVITGYISSYIYYFDGVSAPRRVNPLTKVVAGRMGYNPQQDTFFIAESDVSGVVYFYNATIDAWGFASTPFTGINSTQKPVLGDFSARSEKSTMPVYYKATAADTITRYAHGATVGDNPGTCYLETAMLGKPDEKTHFSRVTPILRRRRDLGADSASLRLTLFREMHDTTAQTTRTISESTDRKRFDLAGGTCTDNFARFKVTFADLDVEVDDFLITQKHAGLN
jgi:hypothetical protein